MRVFAVQVERVSYLPFIVVEENALKVAAFAQLDDIENKKEITADTLLSELQKADNANEWLPAALQNTYVGGDCLKNGLGGNWECVSLSVLNPAQLGKMAGAGFGENDDRATWATFWDGRQSRLSPIINTTVQQYQVKGRNARRRALNWFHPEAAMLFVPFKEQPILAETNTLMFYYNPDLGYLIKGVEATEVTRSETANTPQLQANELFPAIELELPSEVAAGEVLNGECRLFFRGELWQGKTEVVLEATGGYLPLRRLPLTDGTRRFKVLTDGLETGDEIKIKAGWRYFSGEAEAVVKVV